MQRYAPEFFDEPFDKVTRIRQEEERDREQQRSHGGDRHSEDFKYNNVKVETPVGNARATALRKLRAEAENDPDVAEAVAHRRRIREAEARQAKERQREAGPASVAKREGREDGYANFAEPQEPPHKRTTRERSSKATGYSGPTLDKADEIHDMAEDETQPEPVRKVAREAWGRLSTHGAKVDREHKEVQKSVVENSDHAQAYRDAQWRKELLKELGRLGDLKTFDPDRVIAVCDEDQIFLIDSICKGVAEWHAEISRLHGSGLRVVQGGAGR